MRLHKVCLFLGCIAFRSGFATEPELSDRFYQAIRAGNLVALKALTRNENVNARDKRGATPLMYAAAFGNIQEMKLLLDAGADVNARSTSGATALIWAAGEPLRSRMLIERGADVNAQSRQGRTPLMAAARREGAADLVRLMLAKGADITAKDIQDDTALTLASRTGDLETIKLLIDRGADINAPADTLGFTAFTGAIASGNVAAVRLLLAKGADIHTTVTTRHRVRHGLPMIGNLTPLMLAASWGSAAMIKTLLEAGADVNKRDVRGMTALMLAVGSENQDTAVVNLLLGAKADLNIKSEMGETALDWAKKFGSQAVIETLEHAGANEGTPYIAPTAVEPGKPREVRGALEKSVQLLRRSSTEFFKQSGCVSCHDQSLTARVVAAVRPGAIPVDEDATQEQLKTIRKTIRTQAAAMQEFALQGMDEGIPDIFVTLLQGLAAGGFAPDIVTDSLVADVATLQRADGRWSAGIFVSRPPIEESDISRTAQAVRTLQLYTSPARQAEFDGRVARARVWLLSAKKLGTTDEQAMLLLGLSWTGAEQQKIREVALSLIARQRVDGGWAGNPNLTSEAFSTGEALYALREAGFANAADAVFRRGVEYLLRTQHADGSWYVRSRAPKIQPYFQSGFPFDHDQWISAAGTAWASMALAAEPGDWR
jgi:ankyrin repeat protein